MRLAQEWAINEVDNKLAELNKVIAEQRGWRILFSDIKLEFDFSRLGAMVFTGLVAGHTSGLELVGAVVGGAASFISVKSNLRHKLSELPAQLQPYGYLHQAHAELSLTRVNMETRASFFL